MTIERYRLLQLRDQPDREMTSEERVEILDLALIGLATRQTLEISARSRYPRGHDADPRLVDALDDLSKW